MLTVGTALSLLKNSPILQSTVVSTSVFTARC